MNQGSTTLSSIKRGAPDVGYIDPAILQIDQRQLDGSRQGHGLFVRPTMTLIEVKRLASQDYLLERVAVAAR